jgi:tryptophan synthase alpha chain
VIGRDTGGAAAARQARTGPLEAHLRSRRDAGHKLLVPYVTGGMGPDWIEAIHAVADAGADAVEIGIPFSDPMIDGPVIQEASLRALQRGTTPTMVLDALTRADVAVPLCVMTYYNIVFRAGLRRFARSLADAGVAGAIIPDLPLEEGEQWCAEADDAGIATVLLVAPSTPHDRAVAICARARGFVYAVGVMGVTGERAALASTAGDVARMVRGVTDRPVCIGIGVSTAQQAAQACADADGVVVGSAIVRRLLDGAGPEGAGAFVASLRAGIDEASS